MERSRRQLAGLLVLAVTSALFAVVPAAAAEPRTRGIEGVCPAPEASGAAGSETFPDLDTTHDASIVCAADYGIVGGFDDGTFGPGEPITRGQMATFVAAWIGTATGIALPVPAEPAFSDIDDSVHATAIAAIGQAGIVGGRSDGSFGPGATLTRGQFTRAIANAISYADVFAVGGPLPPPDTDVTFTDVAGTTFESTILSLAGIGVALGTADGAFEPRGSVTRGQMTTFLMRAADYLDRHQRWRPTARSGVVLFAELEGASTASGSATLTINAFNGTLAYSLDLSNVPGPYTDPGATLHLGDVVAGGPLALVLADVEALGESTGGVVTGVVEEADSSVRFADLALAPEDAYVQIATEDAPGGAVRGRLRALTG